MLENLSEVLAILVEDRKTVRAGSLVMEYLNRLRSTISTVTSTVSSALPGNPVTREYEPIAHVASAGPGLCWKIYSGRKRTTKQEVSVWVFEKRDVEKWPKRERDMILEILKRGVSQLTRLRHPRLLTIQHPLEESRESYAFCTEPVYASLANALGRVDNMPSIIPPHLTDFQLLDVEIRHGLFQITEALSFLHVDAKILHRNVAPESIIINEKGGWKLAGFYFCAANAAGPDQPPSFPLIEWEPDLMPCVQPSLDYMAPEYVVGGRCDPAADIFSLGVLAFAVFNKGRTPMNNENNLSSFKKNARQLKALPPSLLRNIPDGLREDVKMCLNYTPDLRPDATQFSKVGYFDDVTIKTLSYLDSLCQMDNTQKSQFFKGLPNVLAHFPQRAQLQKILPYLTGEFTTPELIPFILPSIFHISEEASDPEFASLIFPHLVPVFKIEKPFQISLMILQKMELLLKKTPEAEIKVHLLPLVYSALISNTTQIQELCLTIVPKIAHLVDRESMKSQLVPKLLSLGVEASVLSVKVNSLLCIGRLLDHLEKWMVTDQILPTLPRIGSKEPGVLMAILGIYKLSFRSPKLGISKEACAKSCLPFLIPASVENSLNLPQFEAFSTLIRQMLDKVEEEQRNRLQQLSAMQEDQRAMPDFNQVVSQSEAKKHVPKDLHGLGDFQEYAPKTGSSTPNGITPERQRRGPLSLEEKRRIAAEQEQNLRMRAQPSLTPTSTKNSPASFVMANSGISARSSTGSSPMTPSNLASSSFAQRVEQKPIDLTSMLMSPPQSANPIQRPAFGGVASPPQQTPMGLPTMGGVGGMTMGSSNSGWGGMGPMMSAPPGGGIGGGIRPQQQQQMKQNVDLSAFDSLVSFGNKPQGGSGGARKPMNHQKSPLDDLLG